MEEIAFYMIVAAGASMFVHVALCGFLTSRLFDRPDVLRECFAVPNRSLGTPQRLKLLRVSYYSPFKRSPVFMTPLDGLSRALFFGARLSGAAMFVAWIAFFSIPFLYIHG